MTERSVNKNYRTVAIQWWHTECVSEKNENFEEDWTFCPVNSFTKIKGWILVHYSLRKKQCCGNFHTIIKWENSSFDPDNKALPKIPDSIWEKLKKQTKHLKKCKPYPERG